MDFNTKFTPHTWPDHPEQATLEGKNKVVGFWIFLACEDRLQTLMIVVKQYQY